MIHRATLSSDVGAMIKRSSYIKIFSAAAALLGCVSLDAGMLKCESEAGKITAEKSGRLFTITHSGKYDWEAEFPQETAVSPGDVILLKGDLIQKKVKGTDGGSRLYAGASFYTAEGKKLISQWIVWEAPGLRKGTEKQKFLVRFTVPQNVRKIKPLLYGYKPLEVEVKKLELEKISSSGAKEPQKTARLENDALKVDIDAGAMLTVTDKRSGRVFTQRGFVNGFVSGMKQLSGRKVEFNVNLSPMRKWRVVWSLEENTPELLCTISGDKDMVMPWCFVYPSPFAVSRGERLIVPLNAGMSYPVDELASGPRTLGDLWCFAGGYGLCMSFYGVQRDSDGSGYMAVFETPDDAMLRIKRYGGLYHPGTGWTGSMGKFASERRVRLVFFADGGYVKMAKRYRQEVKKSGLFKTLAEKIKERPAVDRLAGAANIWWFGKREKSLEIYRELKKLGIDRMLWSQGAPAEVVEELRRDPKTLTGRYDIYQDLMDPEIIRTKLSKLYPLPSWPQEAFPDDVVWRNERGDLENGWSIKGKDGKWYSCAVLCPRRAIPYAQKRIGDELKVKKYNSRFIDTTTATRFFECWHPEHPATRSQSKEAKMKLLELVSKKFSLVCGSESGHEAGVPYCDYFEGMMSISCYRPYGSGHRPQEIVNKAPGFVEKYQTGEQYRIPLWELVFHECIVSHWYWGDFNNKVPALWARRDLLNALYGTAPLYAFDEKNFDRFKHRAASSYSRIGAVARMTAHAEMLSHGYLTRDRKVQMTRFSNGVQVIANFGSTVYIDKDGSMVLPLDFNVKRLKR